jgi:hypothetical protein
MMLAGRERGTLTALVSGFKSLSKSGGIIRRNAIRKTVLLTSGVAAPMLNSADGFYDWVGREAQEVSMT